MVSHQERKRLTEKFGGDSSYAAGATLKSAVCLTLVALLAYIGVTTQTPEERYQQAKQNEIAALTGNGAVNQLRTTVVASDASFVPRDGGSESTSE
jgi:hypothetical protein